MITLSWRIIPVGQSYFVPLTPKQVLLPNQYMRIFKILWLIGIWLFASMPVSENSIGNTKNSITKILITECIISMHITRVKTRKKKKRKNKMNKMLSKRKSLIKMRLWIKIWFVRDVGRNLKSTFRTTTWGSMTKYSTKLRITDSLKTILWNASMRT